MIDEGALRALVADVSTGRLSRRRFVGMLTAAGVTGPMAAQMLGRDAAEAQTGTMYRFQADTLKGTVWILGQNARRELESGVNGLAAGRNEIGGMAAGRSS